METRRLNTAEILRPLSEKEAFHFFESPNKYTGKSAFNLFEFSKMTKKINKKSILYHYKRHDFERWIKQTLRDPTLARRIRNIKPKSEAILRTQIHKISKKRLDELKKKRHREKTVKLRKPKAKRKTKSKRTQNKRRQ